MSPDRSEDAGATPVAGEDIPDLADFDRTMTAVMTRWELPRNQLAVTKDGRLVFSRAYGMANRDAGEPVRYPAFFVDATTGLSAAPAGVRSWPSHDLFQRLGSRAHTPN